MVHEISSHSQIKLEVNWGKQDANEIDLMNWDSAFIV